MTLREYLEEQKSKCQKRLDDLGAKEKELADKNDKSEDEAELKAIGDELAELQAEKAEAEAELKEIEAQIDALEKEPAKEEPKEGGEKVEVIVEPKPERKAFLNYEVRTERKAGQKDMTIEERKARAEAFVNNGEKETIKLEEVRATLVSGGSIATPTKVEGIQPNFQRVSSIVDLVRVESNEGMGSAKYAYEIDNP